MKRRRESENQWKARICKESGPFVVFSVHGHMMQGAGWPDLYVAQGNSWYELKIEGGKASTIQRRRIRELRRGGARAFFIWREGEDVHVTGPDDEWVATLRYKARATGALLLELLGEVTVAPGACSGE